MPSISMITRYNLYSWLQRYKIHLSFRSEISQINTIVQKTDQLQKFRENVIPNITIKHKTQKVQFSLRANNNNLVLFRDQYVDQTLMCSKNINHVVSAIILIKNCLFLILQAFEKLVNLSESAHWKPPTWMTVYYSNKVMVLRENRFHPPVRMKQRKSNFRFLLMRKVVFFSSLHVFFLQTTLESQWMLMFLNWCRTASTHNPTSQSRSDSL